MFSAETLIPIITVLAFWIERMREVAKRRNVLPGRVQEKLSFKLFMLCGLLIVFGGIAEFLWRGGVYHRPTLLTGIAITLISFILRRRAIATLGKFWSVHVEIKERHELVSSGPFAWMRHPVYFSMVLELVGIALMIEAWMTLALVLAIFIPTLAYRIVKEEAALSAQFGARFIEYRRKTPMLFPAVGRRLR